MCTTAEPTETCIKCLFFGIFMFDTFCKTVIRAQLIFFFTNTIALETSRPSLMHCEWVD